MAIEKFKNEIGTNLNAYKLIKEDGTSENIKLLRNANILVPGTPLNEDTLNPIVDTLNTNTNDLTSLKTNVSNLTAQQETNTNDIASIKEKNATQDVQIKEANDNIETLQQDTNTLKNQMPNKADLIDGKLPVSQLPSTGVVADKANSLVYGTGQEVTGDDVIANIYNLGAYDTYISNGDGTGTITRQTGYIDYSKYFLDNYSTWVFRPSQNGYEVGKYDTNIYGLSYVPEQITSNIFTKGDDGFVYSNVDGYAIGNTWLSLPSTYNTIDSYVEYFAKNPVTIQYKTSDTYKYTEKVIENVSLMSMPKQGCDWVKEQYENNINLFNFSKVLDNGGVTKAFSGSVVILNGTSTEEEYQGDVGTMELDAGTYTLSNTTLKNSGDIMRLVVHPLDWSWQTTLFLGNANSFTTFTILTKQNLVFAIYQDMNRSYNNLTLGVMLTKGHSICPYKQFNDKKNFIANEFKSTLNLLPFSSGTVTLSTDGDNDLARSITLEAGIYTLSINANKGNTFVAKDTATWSYIATGILGSHSCFVLTKKTSVALYIQSTENASDVPFTIMLTKGVDEYDYQQYYGKIMHFNEVVRNYGETNCAYGWSLQSNQNGTEISFKENDIMLTTKSNQTSVNEILNRLDEMGFKWGSVHVYGNADSTIAPTIKLVKSGAIAFLQVSGLIHGSLYSTQANHLFLTITDEDFIPVSYDETFIFTYNERVGQVTNKTWSTGRVEVNYIEDVGESFFENIRFDILQATTTEGNKYKTNISFTYAWFVRTPPQIANITSIINEE